MPIILIIISLICGITVSYGFAPYQLAWLVFPAIAVFFFLIQKSKTIYYAALIGYSFGLGLFGFGISWLYISINLFGGVNLFGAYFITFLLVAFHSFYPALISVIIYSLFKTSNPILKVLAFSSLWTLIEWCRTWFLSGFPWLSLGYTQTDTLFMNIAPIAGVFGISFCILLISCSLSLIVTETIKTKIISMVLIAIISLVNYVLQGVQWTKEADQPYKIALIQAAIPQKLKWQPDQRQRTIDLYLSLSEPHWNSDLIIWPETALPFFFHDQLNFIDELSNKVQENSAELLTGIPYSDPESQNYYNSVVSLGTSQGIYLKRHLVPFGEYLPLDGFIRPILHGMGISMSDFSAGANIKPIIELKDVPVGISICYEDVFGEEVIDALPEAKILINVSNDAWFGDSAAPHQHLQMARMRAKETGRYLLRATNTGISAIINHTGKIESQSPQFSPHALAAEVTLFDGMTPYAKSGNLPIVIISLVLLFFCIVKRKTAINL